MFNKKKTYQVGDKYIGERVDFVLSKLEPDVSRQYFQKLITGKRIVIGKKYLKPSYRIKGDESVIVDYPAPIKLELEPVKLPLRIVFEDDYLMVVDKDAGVVVHPSEKGKFMGKSLVNAALAHIGDGLKAIGGVLRPGIVHRLDKDTSGLIIIAKTDLSHQRLVEMFRNREIDKRYLALVVGEVKNKHAIIDLPIGRDADKRKLMKIDGLLSKNAKTEYWLRKLFMLSKNIKASLLDVKIYSGRTHQIRVHLSSVGYPLVGDNDYGNKKINKFVSENLDLKRQFLHAYKLSFVHPITKKPVDLEIDLPDDLKNFIEKLNS